ncbi:hypothetical protein [Streptomyces albireticuli]|uniref:Uncharacterized protein n=1 Tax=Streptomyces albireticuli TaxID=1940 RepID=A0A2A2DA28_9ACTN|nr:hypothetical protein [Streptomyces albireticuli]MCD9145539.1 hypothetical protein [Streptomyces albireticuli]MCD9165171.1 hypothetical protein [Streptomyces albireticuli]MCD9195700.1 hypothetical protein [Streptomyces albireticuli]PAU48375.1 hypothetical protein CK936_13665 [Streptomyces albireticuli]
MDGKGESEAKQKNKRLELSVAQVAGSALAAVIAALLAGKLGVYGTVIGAGVVSVVATSGGTIFQHLFKRTGEQLREATTQAARPKMRQVPVRDASRAVGRGGPGRDHTRPLGRMGDADATRLLPGVDPAAPRSAVDATQLLPGVNHPPERNGAHAGAHSGPHADPHSDGHDGTAAPFDDEYTSGTTHGTRLRGYKRPLLAAAAIFALAMGTVTVVELVGGGAADGGKGTSVGQILTGGNSGKKQDPAPEKDPERGSERGGGQESGKDSDGGGTPDPGTSEPGGDPGKRSPDPSTSPDPVDPSTGGSSQSPKPDPSGGGQSPDSGKGGSDGGKTDGGTTTGGAAGGGRTTPKPPEQNAAAGAATPPKQGVAS